MALIRARFYTRRGQKIKRPAIRETAIGVERHFDFALPALDAYQREAGWHFGGTAEKTPSKSRKLVGGDGRSRTYDTADMSRML